VTNCAHVLKRDKVIDIKQTKTPYVLGKVQLSILKSGQVLIRLNEDSKVLGQIMTKRERTKIRETTSLLKATDNC